MAANRRPEGMEDGWMSPRERERKKKTWLALSKAVALLYSPCYCLRHKHHARYEVAPPFSFLLLASEHSLFRFMLLSGFAFSFAHSNFLLRPLVVAAGLAFRSMDRQVSSLYAYNPCRPLPPPPPPPPPPRPYLGRYLPC